MGAMIYQLYQSHADAMAPMRQFARASLPMLKDTRYGLNLLPSVRKMAAAMQVFALADLTHKRPAFGIAQVKVGEKCVAIEEEVVHSTPFGSLLRFRKEGARAGEPRVLIVAPMSGHFATLLRETVRTMLQDHDVFITDWHNAREMPLEAGRFGLD